MNVSDSRVEELCHQKGNQETSEHESINYCESKSLFGLILWFMFKVMIMMQKVDTNSVNNGRDNDTKETTVPLFIEQEPRLAISSVENG